MHTRLPQLMSTRPLRHRLAGLACIALGVTGCVNTDMSDLDAYINQVKQIKSSRIQPLPEISIAEVFIYEPAGRTDPFVPFIQAGAEPDVVVAGAGGVQPPTNHVREELEYYPLDSLRMVGTMAQDDEFWALVTDPDGAVHRVQTGNYMGNNFGKITAIEESRIMLVEIVPDNLGGWQERAAELDLSE